MWPRKDLAPGDDVALKEISAVTMQHVQGLDQQRLGEAEAIEPLQGQVLCGSQRFDGTLGQGCDRRGGGEATGADQRSGLRQKTIAAFEGDLALTSAAAFQIGAVADVFIKADEKERENRPWRVVLVEMVQGPEAELEEPLVRLIVFDGDEQEFADDRCRDVAVKMETDVEVGAVQLGFGEKGETGRVPASAYNVEEAEYLKFVDKTLQAFLGALGDCSESPMFAGKESDDDIRLAMIVAIEDDSVGLHGVEMLSEERLRDGQGNPFLFWWRKVDGESVEDEFRSPLRRQADNQFLHGPPARLFSLAEGHGAGGVIVDGQSHLGLFDENYVDMVSSGA